MTIHGSKKKPFSFQEIVKMFPDGKFTFRHERHLGFVTEHEVKQMGQKGFLLVHVEHRDSELWKVDVSTIPASELSKLPEYIFMLHAN